MLYVQIEREEFCQQYKISEVFSRWGKDSLQKTPTLRGCAEVLRVNYQVFIWRQSYWHNRPKTTLSKMVGFLRKKAVLT